MAANKNKHWRGLTKEESALAREIDEGFKSKWRECWLDKKINLFVKLDPNSGVETKYSFKLS